MVSGTFVSRLTTTCSGQDYHKVHTRHCHASIGVSGSAPQVRRTAAAVERYAAFA